MSFSLFWESIFLLSLLLRGQKKVIPLQKHFYSNILFKNPHIVEIQTDQLLMNFPKFATAKTYGTILSFRSQSEAINSYNRIEYKCAFLEKDCFSSLR